MTQPRAWCLYIFWICLLDLCLQTVAQVWGHPEDLIVLSQQSSWERGRRMHTNHQPALFTGGNKSMGLYSCQWNKRLNNPYQAQLVCNRFLFDCFISHNISLVYFYILHAQCSLCLIMFSCCDTTHPREVVPSFPRFFLLLSQQYRSTTLPAFKYYITCACLIFCCIFIVQVLVLPK